MKHKIDITPRWENLVGLFEDWLKSGTLSQKETAHEHLIQMAKICDIVKDHSAIIQAALNKSGIDVKISKR